jgi:hypothetical protein
MAYNFTAASSQRLTANSPVSGPPVTIAIWIYPAASGSFYFELQQGGGTNNRDRIRVLPSGSNVSAQTISEDPYTGEPASTSSGTFTRQAWNHIAGVFASNSSRTVYLNGVAGATNTTTNIVRPLTKININAIEFTFGSNITYGNGIYAEAGVWNVALTAAEVASLAKGMTCDKVRPNALVFYAPLIRSLQDLSRAAAITNNNGATVANHPRVYA